MSKVVGFWSPKHGMTGTTTLAALSALYGAAVSKDEVFLTTPQHYRHSRITKVLNLDFEDQMARIHNFAKENALNDELLRIMSRKIEGIGLYVIEGTENKRVFESINESIDVTLKVSSKTFDYVFVDMNAGDVQSKSFESISKRLDGLVVLLPQEEEVIENYYEHFQEIIVNQNPDMKIIYVIGRYVDYDHFNVKRIGRSFKIKNLYRFTQSEPIHKAIYQGTLIDRMLLEMDSKAKEFGDVLGEVRDLMKAIEKI